MGSTIWANVQSYGYPIYMLLGHLLNAVPWFGLAAKMTILLSALPAAITVGIVYLTVLKLTKKEIIALISAVVLLGCAIFLTEASITKAYSLEAAMLSLAFYAYISNWKYRTLIFLGLATSVHVTALAIAVFWLLADRRWKYWLSGIWVYVLVGIVPYLYVPLLMYLDTPRFMVGSLSLENLINYVSSTGRAIVGNISIFETPARLLWVSKIILMSFGLALVPLIMSLKRPYDRSKLILVATILFFLWYVVTCLDAQTWTYLSLAAPSAAILIGIGLSKMKKEHLIAVGASACILVCLNGFFLNANTIDKQNPVGMNYLNELKSLPDDSVVVSEPGPYSLGLFYCISTGKSLVPLIYPYIEQPLFNVNGYNEFLHDKYSVPMFSDTLSGVRWCLNNGTPVYLALQPESVIQRCFNISGIGKVGQIVGLTGLQPDTYMKDVTYR